MSNNKLIKDNIIKNLSKQTGFSFRFSKKLINDLINIFIKNIKTNNFNLKNIGTFKLINKRERWGRDPKTKEEFIINSRKTLSFITSKNLSNLLNKNNE